MLLGKGKMTERLILLYSRDEIARRVHELARIISAHYADKDLVLIGILRGALVFLTDLTRHLTIPAAVDFIGAASYGYHSKSSGQIQITKELQIPIRGRDVLLASEGCAPGWELHNCTRTRVGV